MYVILLLAALAVKCLGETGGNIVGSGDACADSVSVNGSCQSIPFKDEGEESALLQGKSFALQGKRLARRDIFVGPSFQALPQIRILTNPSWTTYIEISVGTPEQAAVVQWDAGSAQFWVLDKGSSCPPAYSPASSHTKVKTKHSGSVGYGMGWVNGTVYEDTLTLPLASGDTLVTPAVKVIATTQFDMSNCETSLGTLGACEDSATVQQILSAHDLPLMYSLSWQRPIWSEADVLGYVPAGTITLGGVDQREYVGGLHCIDTLSKEQRNLPPPKYNQGGHLVKNEKWWMFAVEDVTIGDKSYGPMHTFIDSGCSDLIMTENMTSSIGTVEPDCSNYGVLADIVVTLPGGQNISLGPEEYINRQVQTSGAKQCSIRVASISDSPVSIVLGVPFFLKYYALFDYSHQRIGIALQTGVAGMPLTGTCSEV